MEGVQQSIGNVTAHNSNVGIFNHNDNILRRLPYNPHAAFNAGARDDKERLQRGTRVEILKRIQNWIESESENEPHIFWLDGWAGSGKTTIAHDISQRYHEDGRFWFASYFFSRDEQTTSGNTTFVCTLARQLAEQRSNFGQAGKNITTEYKRVLTNILETYEGLADRVASEQWKEIIVKPLSGLKNTKGFSHLVIVLDALDEHPKHNQITNLISLIRGTYALGKFRPRFLITSRPEDVIRDAFDLRQNQGPPLRMFSLHTEKDDFVNRDIKLYIREKLSRFRLSSHDVDKLADNAARSFIWISTACRAILAKRSSAQQSTALKRLLLTTANSNPEKQLNDLYSEILGRSFSEDEDEDEDDFQDVQNLKMVLGSLAVLKNPLSAQSLDQLLGMKLGNVDSILSDLHAIVYTPQQQEGGIWGSPLRLHHPSLHDYLINEKRCDERFHVPSTKAHKILFEHCLALMSAQLKQDICDLKAPGSRSADLSESQLEQNLSPATQYACLSWFFHFQNSGQRLSDEDHVHNFLTTYFLFWLESLAWMRHVSEAIYVLITLESQAEEDDSARLQAFVHDARRFALFGRTILDEAPLQIYSTLLILAPSKSIVVNTFADHVAPWVERLGRKETGWSAYLHTLETHAIATMAFLNNTELLTGDTEGNIHLWDLNTGTLVQTLEEHNNRRICQLVPSPDGDQAATVMERNFEEYFLQYEIVIWNLKTSSLIRKHTEKPGHTWLAVHWSVDTCHWIAASVGSYELYIWDLRSDNRNFKIPAGQHVLPTEVYSYHKSSDMRVTFSSSGQNVAFEDYRFVSIWSITPGLRPYTKVFLRKGERNLKKSLSTLKNALRLMPASRICFPIYDIHHDIVIANIFMSEISYIIPYSDHDLVATSLISPDKSFISCYTGANTIEIWDSSLSHMDNDFSLVSRAKIHAPQFQIGMMIKLAPDKNLLATVSRSDCHPKVWDTQQKPGIRDSEDMCQLLHIAFSINGQFAAGICKIHLSIDVLNVQKLKILHQFKEPLGWKICDLVEDQPKKEVVLKFLQDGTTLFARIQGSSRVYLWDILTGLPISTTEIEPFTNIVSLDRYFIGPGNRIILNTGNKRMPFLEILGRVSKAEPQGLENKVLQTAAVGASLIHELIQNRDPDRNFRVDVLLRNYSTKAEIRIKHLSGGVLWAALSCTGTKLAIKDRRTIYLYDISYSTYLPLCESLDFKELNELGTFSPDDNALNTPRCILAIRDPGGVGEWNLVEKFVIDKNWIRWKGMNIFWLPPHFRDSKARVNPIERNKVIVSLFHETEGMVFLKFDFNELERLRI
ncbi:hypothetical protein B0J11DRAFT_595576 [Dendryphion nanum]|uniref:Nephrocystin 3-like N-terminal domain-containing protein n=1 Tax=Dendryphion nanum TaxID=256645 RepID=A0A9P9I9Q4_9PLEO|nr:hypothetical protein B0J11DRAFT_595576 [Dendryphion nanum]